MPVRAVARPPRPLDEFTIRRCAQGCQALETELILNISVQFVGKVGFSDMSLMQAAAQSNAGRRSAGDVASLAALSGSTKTEPPPTEPKEHGAPTTFGLRGAQPCLGDLARYNRVSPIWACPADSPISQPPRRRP